MRRGDNRAARGRVGVGLRLLAPPVLAVCAAALVVGCTASPPSAIESTETPTVTAVPVDTDNLIVVAIDEVGLGFNPHLLAHQSPVSTAIGTLVLPSPFRPVPAPGRPGASDWVLDGALVESAGVTSDGSGAEPFTVTYVLRNEAQWSDGAPIAAEDFHYLWRQMVTQPGVVDPAGYRLIEGVRSAAGGKTVVVTFAQPYPAWRELFANLLPAHLVKDTPGGFDEGMADTIPVSGGHFHIEAVDRGRDEILLERNDRYWGTPTVPDRLLLRRGGTAAQVAESLRRSDAQVASVHGGLSLQAQLSAIRGVRTAREYQPRLLQLVLNGRVEGLEDPQVRRAVLALLAPDTLATVGSGGSSSAAVAQALLRAPSDPGYAPTEPPRMRYDDAMAVFAQRGYSLVEGVLRRGGTPDGEAFHVVIGAPAGDTTAIAVASTAADQLTFAGVQASVAPTTPSRLFGDALLGGEVDAVVGWVRAGSDLATSLASRWGCGAVGSGGPAPDGQPAGGTGAPRTSAAPEQGGGDDVPPSNLPGVCDLSVQGLIDAALVGARPLDEVDELVEPKLWELAVVQPILQDTTMVAASDEIEDISLAGPVPAGMFFDADLWTRAGR